ncbi:MAG: hypothetical protein J0M28_15950 [Thauera sp.]|nr:hypothetical protein [Thauera sp.]
MGPYNGYTAKERQEKFDELKRRRAAGLPQESTPCMMCGDPEAPVEQHSEDYSKPYRWTPPAEYALCGSCHYWLHQRFGKSLAWHAYKAHMRRGGYGKEFTDKEVKKERKAFEAAQASGQEYTWRELPGRVARTGMDWWEHLTLSPDALAALWARPRP